MMKRNSSAGKTGFGGRSALPSRGENNTTYGGRPAVPKGKPETVTMGGVADGNRRTAKASMGSSTEGCGATFRGHGGFTRG